ncbi:hypothetical protein AVEN_124725-1 [Araneus ventricosus]|uniref:Uncharacterized protein n=1 Tax=Araneus ventricosus TaxID=182803 RepID=A0A4Y2H097_ARAVE|nr:hypothetical protein AVEN_124725-1 [Araneus ventricosus]
MDWFEAYTMNLCWNGSRTAVFRSRSSDSESRSPRPLKEIEAPEVLKYHTACLQIKLMKLKNPISLRNFCTPHSFSMGPLCSMKEKSDIKKKLEIPEVNAVDTIDQKLISDVHFHKFSLYGKKFQN